MTRWTLSPWAWMASLCLLALFALFPVKRADAASCSSTLSFAATGDTASQDFQSCNTYIEPGSGSGWTDTSNARWAGIQTTLGHGVRGIFNCGIGVSNGSGSCSGTSATTITTANGTYSVTGSSSDSTLTFTLVSRNNSSAFSDNLTYYTYVGAAVASPTDSVTNTVFTFTLNVAAEGSLLSLSPASGALPDATLGTTYSQAFVVSGGTAPYLWTSTSLPAGLSLNASTGVISGTPTALGDTTFTVTVTDATSSTTTGSYTLHVSTSPPISQNSSASVAADSNNNVMTYPYTGGAPTSVNLIQPPVHGTVVVSGTSVNYTPNAGYSGTDSFDYQLSNSGGTSATATLSITVTPAALTLSPASGAFPDATTGSHWSQTITVNGGTAPYTYSATDLPAGLTISNAGVISGTPSVNGDFPLTVAVTDAASATASGSYTLHVNAAPPVSQNSSAIVAANSSNNVMAYPYTGGPPTSVNVIQPPAHGTVVVSGTSLSYTPNAGYSGTDSFDYQLSNSGGNSATATLAITVTAATLTLSPASGALPDATKGTNWSQTITASGGTAPYTFSATGLPAGILLNNAGVLSGTPTASGDVTFSVTATDAYSASASTTFSLHISGQAPSAGSVSASVVANSSSNVVLDLTGGTVASLAIVQSVTHGSLSVAGLRIRYTPVQGYSGADSFTYTVTNADGTSAPATVTLTIAQPSLSFSPVTGSLPNATAMQTYHQVFSVAGGMAPYHFTVSGSLPAGMIFTDGVLSGTPQTAGIVHFSITATDSLGATSTSQYSLHTAVALPVAPDRSATIYAGQTLRMNLIQGASGGPFSSATLSDLPDPSQGNSAVEHRGNDFSLVFKAAPLANSVVTMHYTLASASGVSQPGTISIVISARPDPSRDADVIGLISAMAQSAEDFAKAQIHNFSDRLEQLHTEANTGNSLTGIHFNMPQSRQSYEAPLQFGQAATETNGDRNMPFLQNSERSSKTLSPETTSNSPLAFWTGGFVDFGSTRDNVVRFSHTLAGVSSGADYRITPALTLGAGVGFGREVNDIGDSGTRTRDHSTSTAMYGSYHPGAFYLDGLLGYSWLDFDSRRYVNEADIFASGSRSGHQLFASLASGYEIRSANSMIAPYVQLSYVQHWLDSFTESQADAFNLAYARQEITQLTGTAGLRGIYGIPVSWGIVRLQSRVEYSQVISDEGRAGVGYADVADNTWSIQTIGESKEMLTMGVGVDFLLPFNINPGIGYQGTLGLDDRQSRSSMVMLKVNIGF